MQRFLIGILSILLISGCGDSSEPPSNLDVGTKTKQNNTILVLGDSIAAGYASNNYRSNVIFPKVIEDIIGLKVINDSVPGITAEKAISKLPMLLESEKPKYLVILLGTNNALGRHGSTVNSALNSLQSAVKIASDLSVITIIGTLPPISRNAQENANTSAISAGIVKIREARIALIDQVISANDLVDGIHPSDRGQTKIAQEFAKHLY